MNEELRPTLMPIKDYELGFVEGGKVERKKLIDELTHQINEMELHPTFMDTFENTWIHVGFKRALNIIKESK